MDIHALETRRITHNCLSECSSINGIVFGGYHGISTDELRKSI